MGEEWLTEIKRRSRDEEWFTEVERRCRDEEWFTEVEKGATSVRNDLRRLVYFVNYVLCAIDVLFFC